MPAPGLLASIDHVVVLMLENRSFDHLLGFLYADSGNVSPLGHPFEGLTGAETNPAPDGSEVAVYRLAPSPGVYYSPGADPGEGYAATSSQLFGSATPTAGATPSMDGFVANFAATLAWEHQQGRAIQPGTVPTDIMGMFTPELLPVLSGLARGYAVCDGWFASVPTETMPNRAFVAAATSQGHLDDATKSFTCPSIFGVMSQHGVSWAIYGYEAEPLTRLDFPDTMAAPASHFGLFADFSAAASAGTLPAYSFLEPSWSATGNSEHPPYDVALGEQLVHDVYEALRNGPGWPFTLLVVVYDEHGGCYDHVPPPVGAVPPDASIGEFGFDFTRFGVRVPAVLVSPLIEAGTVLRPPGTTPFDHTSILATLEQRFGLPALTARDAAAPALGGVLTLAQPRSDDPLAGVVVPRSSGANAAAGEPSHLQEVYADLVARLPVTAGGPAPAGSAVSAGNAVSAVSAVSAGGPAPAGSTVTPRVPPALRTAGDYDRFVADRLAAWHRAGDPLGGDAPASEHRASGANGRARDPAGA